MDKEVLLQMTDICKEFPGVKALDGVSLTVKRGTVHALTKCMRIQKSCLTIWESM